jgi:FkbM family methyltransferase
MVAHVGHAHLTDRICRFARFFERARIQVEDIIWCRNSLMVCLQLVFALLYRRWVPLPSFVYRFFNSYNLGDKETARETEKFLESYMVPDLGRSFVDVEAYVGTWALFVAKSGVEVHAFEPSPAAYSVLAEKAKGFSNLHVYQYALGDHDSMVKLSLAPFSSLGIVHDENRCLRKENMVNVAMRTLDAIRLTDIGVVKIDTGGYEVPILVGAKATILKNRPRLIIEVHKGTGNALPNFPEELHRIKNVLRSYGYSCIVYHRRLGGGEMQPFIIANPTF